MKYIIIIAVIFLFIANPTQEDFNRFAQEYTRSNTNSGEPILDSFAGAFVAEIAAENTYRKDYYIFSVYTVDLSLIALFSTNVPNDIKILGIAGNFFPISSIR
jgi:hypothetical protein